VNLQLNNHSVSKLGEFWRRIMSYIMILFYVVKFRNQWQCMPVSLKGRPLKVV